MSQDKINIQQALNEQGGLQVWWRLLRPHTLTASFVPVFVGTMFAFIHDNIFHFGLFLAMMFAAILIQAATNMFNEYYDFVRGLDKADSVGIGGTIVRDGVAPKTIMRLALLFFAGAIVLGIYICIASSWWIALIGALSMLVGYLYTGGPMPIAYTPFGELCAGFLMGTVMIAISYYIQTLQLSGDVLIISIPIAIFIATIMLSNNIRDLDNDKESGRKTIAILLGRKKAVVFLALLFTIAYVSTAAFIVLGLLPLWSLLTFLSAKTAIDVIIGFQGKTKPIEMMPAMVKTGKTNTRYGMLLGISLLIGHFF